MIGKPTNSECFLTRSLRRRSSRYSAMSSFIVRTMRVPRPMRLASGASGDTVNEPPAADSHVYCSSSFDFEVTTTFSATRYAE